MHATLQPPPASIADPAPQRPPPLPGAACHAPTAEELAGLHKPLLRYAMLQLRNEAMAQDVVSETLLALLERPAAFEGRSSLRTYATGILKFKIADLLRRRGRELPLETLDEQSVDDALDALFAADGHWAEPQAAWPQPERALEQAQFFHVLQLCLERLPARIARVFMLREWLEHDIDQICGELGITANNCSVMLYRARMALRECLQRSWFTDAAASPR
jgi:RNA polymerase sigma-70 factor (ECF subfamily)